MREMGKRISLIFLAAALLCAGCSRESRTSTRPMHSSVREAPDWGPSAEGVQSRLRPTRRLWQQGEPITFKLDLRNRGSRLFAFDVREPIRPSRIAIDRRWRHLRRDQTTQTKIQPLAPGTELTDLEVIVSPEKGLPLGAGRHTIQISLELEDLTVLTNPVAIEIAAPPAEVAR